MGENLFFFFSSVGRWCCCYSYVLKYCTFLCSKGALHNETIGGTQMLVGDRRKQRKVWEIKVRK